MGIKYNFADPDLGSDSQYFFTPVSRSGLSFYRMLCNIFWGEEDFNSHSIGENNFLYFLFCEI
jgi:hypothetical protein